MLLSIAKSLLKESDQHWKTVVPSIFASSSHFPEDFVWTIHFRFSFLIIENTELIILRMVRQNEKH